ncbi:MAG: dienelactone hydrolase family protein [Myxococcales bacterium]|nr:dienelactone hydrolase family protein [Myxococcales bacterium]
MGIDERTIEAVVEDGVAQGLLLVPEGDGPFPLVLFFMDALGLRPAMTDMGRRLAAAGYAVIQPDLYWRSAPVAPFDWATCWSDEGERGRLFGLMNAVHKDQVMADARALIGAIDDPRVRTTRIGAVGYCMGGRMTMFAAADLADLVAAAASIHGGGLVRDAAVSPHRGAPAMKAALYVGVADEDNSCTPADCEVLEAALRDAGVRYQLEHNPGARHGYAVPDAPVFHAEAAERHWERVLALFGAELA